MQLLFLQRLWALLILELQENSRNMGLLKRGIEAIYSIVMAIVTFVLRLTPYGILAIMASTLATSDFSAIWTLGKFLMLHTQL